MNGWKVTAIIFIVLFVLETIFLLYAYKIGTEAVTNEYNCAYVFCSEYPSYSFDDYTGLCKCYENNREVAVKVFD